MINQKTCKLPLTKKRRKAIQLALVENMIDQLSNDPTYANDVAMFGCDGVTTMSDTRLVAEAATAFGDHPDW